MNRGEFFSRKNAVTMPMNAFQLRTVYPSTRFDSSSMLIVTLSGLLISLRTHFLRPNLTAITSVG